jgi:hypothetical protein
MSNKEKYFNVVNKLFWILLVIVSVFSLLHLNPKIFDEKNTARNLILEDSLIKVDLILVEETKKDDTVKKTDADYIKRTWSWKSFDGKRYTINFKVLKSDFINATNRRAKSKNIESDLYSELSYGDYQGLSDMIDQYKEIIAKENLDYYGSMDMIVSSIQNIPYVLVVPNACPLTDFGMTFTNNCAVSTNPSGCCSFVMPWGVFSPIEFAIKSTGDCDTRSLFAYTILKNLGYDIAVMVSNSESHSVLGVSVPNIPKGGDRTGNGYFASKYYLWELTSYGPLLGQNSTKGNDWRIALN